MKTVVVGLSGGVDSAVSAHLLKQQGYRVIGLFMKNWEEDDASGHCQSEQDFEDVARVCEMLDIPYYGVNFVKEYQERVFADFLKEIEQGHTPNPDILCNREIKFDVFFKKAMELGADYLATGHYCQTDGKHLLRGADRNKDQSYFLHAIDGKCLEKVLFPIGHMQKSEVRKIAKELGLCVAEKRDSTGICFIGKRPFKEFLQRYIAVRPGHFIDEGGKVLGEHDGVCFYTIGQRKGLGIGGPGEAWFVADKDLEKNTVTLVQGEHHSRLYAKELVASDVNWIGEAPVLPLRCTAKVRYRSKDSPCTVTEDLRVVFDRPERAITARQSVVFYDGERCLGGALIELTTEDTENTEASPS